MRGAPGSGKSYLAKLIKEKETEINGGSGVRILSIDDYFTTETDEVIVDPDTGKKVKYFYINSIREQIILERRNLMPL